MSKLCVHRTYEMYMYVRYNVSITNNMIVCKEGGRS